MPIFFFPLGTRLTNEGTDGAHARIDRVYGPYDNRDAAEEFICAKWPNDKTARFLIIEGEILGITPSPLEKPDDQKRPAGDFEFYIKQHDGGYKCATCGATIMNATVVHPIHDGPFPGSGSGDVQREDVPYCINCEIKPNSAGDPIRPSGSLE